jgi:hypothetical protein
MNDKGDWRQSPTMMTGSTEDGCGWRGFDVSPARLAIRLLQAQKECLHAANICYNV